MRVALAFVALFFAQQPSFKSGVDLVRVPVTVTRSGESVREGLTAADFSLTEDGVAQPIAVFERDTLPISLCVALDVSGSMDHGPIDFARLAIRALSGELREPDEIAVITFAETPQVVIPWSPPVAAARLALTAAGGTSLNDATRASLDLLESAHNPRPVILLITDGFDTSSRLQLSEIVKSRRQSEALVYAFDAAPNIAASRIDQFGTDIMTPPGAGPPPAIQLRGEPAVSSTPSLVGDSGGTTFPLSSLGDAQRSARRLIDELRYQYTLGYSPSKSFDGRYRRVKVAINKRGYQVRHRGGYLAMPAKP